MMFRARSVHAVAVFALGAACGDPEGPTPRPSPGDVVVLNGVAPTGISILAEPGNHPQLLSFEPFDGASFALRNDTVASTASKAAGDLLYIGLLEDGRVFKIQMPAASNPAGVQFKPAAAGGSEGARVYVALRDVGKVAEVPLPSASGSTVLHSNAGVCPVDVVATTTRVWSLDANQRCASDYATLGPSRLVPLPGQGSADTITFASNVVSAQRAFVVGDHAYIMSSGNYFSIPGAVTKVDLVARNSVVVPLDDNYYAMAFRIGRNGHAYVTAAPPFDPAVKHPARVYAIRLETMTFGGTRADAGRHLKLTKTDGSSANCFAATADASNNVYCLENGNTVATLLVFNSQGQQIQSVPAGSLAFDIALR